MTKSELFKAAHKIARETKAIAGSYRIAFSCALKALYAGIASVEEKSPLQKAFEHFAETCKVYTYATGDEVVFVAPSALHLNPPKRVKNGPISVRITRTAYGEYTAAYNDIYASGRATIETAIEAMFA